MSAIAEPLPRPRHLGVGRVPSPLIGVLPVDVVPESVRPALKRYAADTSEPSRVQLVEAVDQAGYGWEQAIARRAVAARMELVEACRLAAALNDELAGLQAAAQWLRCFPWRSVWDPEPYSLHIPGHQAASVPEVLGAIEDTCLVDERLIRIARRSAPRDPPYTPPAPRLPRPGSGPAQNALFEAGPTLGDVAELMPAGASISAVSRWLTGDRPYPKQLPGVLEQLVDAETAGRIMRLIPPPAQP